jgi:hypothetical protein
MKEIDCIESSVVKVAMGTALQILEKWGCNQQQIQAVLRLPESYSDLDFEQVNFSREQVERVSYILNIHASLSTLFSNPENVYGFMNMVNLNQPFNGTRPIDFIYNSEIDKFKILFVHIDQLLKR